MHTLLIIDMQNAWLNADVARFDKDGVIARINLAADATRQRGGQVIFIRHVSDEAPLGSDGWQIVPSLLVADADRMIDKRACDSFVDTDLLEALTDAGASTLHICGMATEFCVDSTLRAALSHGFDVVALADAHTSGDRPHLSAAKIVEHHNWTWENLAVQSGRQIRVRTVAQAFT